MHRYLHVQLAHATEYSLAVLLESQSAERLARQRLALGALLLLGLRHESLDGRTIRWRRQIVHDRVEQQTDAAVFLSRTAMDGSQLARKRAEAQRFPQHL